MIWCRCNAHLVESDDDQTPDETCCHCRGKPFAWARRSRRAYGTHNNAHRAHPGAAAGRAG
jgi:hypothetical protein